MDVDKKIREIEAQIDVFHNQSDFFKRYGDNQAQALYDILRVYEGIFSSVLLGCIGQEMLGLQNAHQALLSDTQNLQDALNTAILWIIKGCNTTTSSLSHQLSESAANEAADFLIKYADPYSVIVDGYISYSRKQNTARVDGNKVIFDITKEQSTSFLRDVGEKLNEERHDFSSMIMDICLSPQFQSEFNAFAETIRIEDGEMSYELSGKLCSYAYDIGCKQWDETSKVPQEWEFDHFSLLAFRRCWAAFYATCLVHLLACIKSRLPGMAQENAVIQLPRNTVVEFIEKISGENKETVDAVIDFLTFDPKLKNTDIMYQPLLTIEDSLIITPTLILTSIPERNLIAVIQKKNDSKYTVEVNDLECIMIDEVIGMLPENTKYCRSKKLSKDLPDVDFAIYDYTTNSILIAEMKWLIAADSAKEVLERQKDIDHGCSQVEAIMGYAMADPIAFANRLFQETISDKPDLFWCVVAKHNIRSTSNLVPVITQDGLGELLKRFSLSTVFHKIRNREFYKPLPDKSHIGHKTVQYAGYDFCIPALVIEKEYEVWE